MKAIAVVSGGLDSVTLAYMLRALNMELRLLSFNYGQRHVRELEYAAQCARDLQCEHRVIDLQSLAPLFQGSALVDRDIQVPPGHYAAGNMASTVVPNRNAIMLAIAWAWATSRHADYIAIAVHHGDHAIYPDCRPEFTSAFEEMERRATNADTELLTPFLYQSKTDIVRLGHDLGVPFELTWSCYQGGDAHCGLCGTCVERREAFQLAHVHDPTNYLVG